MRSIISLLFIFFFAVSCNKDDDLTLDNLSYEGSHYEWSEQESFFFDLSNSSGNVGLRESPAEYLIKVYAKIADDNEELDFVEDFVTKLGVPIWRNSHVASDSLEERTLVTIPVVDPESDQITSLIQSEVFRANENFVVQTDLRVKSLIEDNFESDEATNNDCVDYILLKGFQKELYDNYEGFDNLAWGSNCVNQELEPTPADGLDSRCRRSEATVCFWTQCIDETIIIGTGGTGGPFPGSGANGSTGSEGTDTGTGSTGRTGNEGSSSDGTIIVISPPGGITPLEPIDPIPPNPKPVTPPMVMPVVSGGTVEAFADAISDLKEGGQLGARECEPRLICATYAVKECEGLNGWAVVEYLECLSCDDPAPSDLATVAAETKAGKFLDTYGMGANVTMQDLIGLMGGVMNIDVRWSQEEFDEMAKQALIDDFLQSNLHIKEAVDNFLVKYVGPEAEDHADNIVLAMIADSEFKTLVESSFGWSGVMWSIAKELIGDKAIDLLGNIMGVGQVKDLIKAMSHNDWIEFTYELTQLALNNTPLGKALKIIEAGSDMYKFVKQVEKIWDRVGHLAETALANIWNIAKKCPCKVNPDYFKYLDDLSVPRFGSHFATKNTYNANFKRKFAEVKDEISEVHHAIPQEVSDRWNLVGQTEMHSLENLRGMPSRTFHQNITNMWNAFFRPYKDAGTTPAMSDIIDFAKGIDDQYGSQFIPPIR